MTGWHLGDAAAAFVDDALDPVTRDRAAAHLAGCEACRLAVADQRRVKALLAGLPAPSAPPGLAERLALLADAAAAAARGGTAGGAADAGGMTAADGATRAAARAAARVDVPAGRWGAPASSRTGRTRRRALIATGSAGAVLVGAVAVSAAAGQAAVATPQVTPPVDRFAVAHVALTESIPVTAPGLRLATAGVTGGVAPGLAPGLATGAGDPQAGPAGGSIAPVAVTVPAGDR